VRSYQARSYKGFETGPGGDKWLPLGDPHRATPWLWLLYEKCQCYAPLACAVLAIWDPDTARNVSVEPRSFAFDKGYALAKRMRHDQNIGKQDRGIETEPSAATQSPPPVSHRSTSRENRRPSRARPGIRGDTSRIAAVCRAIGGFNLWNGYPKRKTPSEKTGKLRGRSVCYYIEFGGIFNDRMDIRFDPGGTVTVFGGTHSHGQGHILTSAKGCQRSTTSRSWSADRSAGVRDDADGVRHE
jgi:hypothetical protein